MFQHHVVFDCYLVITFMYVIPRVLFTYLEFNLYVIIVLDIAFTKTDIVREETCVVY